MKTYILKSWVFGLVLFIGSSCELEDIPNPNGPTIGNIQSGATLADLRLVATGLESVMRVDMEFYYQTISIVAREYYDLNNIDPRYTGELLGAEGATLDNNGFLTTRSFAARYRAVRNANLLITAVENANAGLTAAEENGFLGYANTIKAYELLLVANRQFQNGIRLDVSDPDNPGPFLGYDQSLTAIQSLLTEAATQLSSAGDTFPFALSAGFAGFDTPATFAQFNRALAARVAIYQGDNSAALTALSNSYFDVAGDLNAGPAHIFGAAGNDILNPLYYVPDNDLYVVHDSWLADAESGDSRVASKTRAFTDGAVTADGLSGDTQVSIYGANTDPVGIIRNEELILIYAEANVGTDNAEAVRAIDVIRTAAGLLPYLGGTSDAELIDEILTQRRYSLFGEGHRWIDLRRYDRLNEVPTDRAGDIVHTQFPRPVVEG